MSYNVLHCITERRQKMIKRNMISLWGYLKEKGYEEEEIRQAVNCFEWDIPIDNPEIEADCESWWDMQFRINAERR